MKKEVNTSHADELIQLLQAAKEGKKIQYKNKKGKAWLKLDKLAFDFDKYEYRTVSELQQITVGVYIDTETKEKLDEICEAIGSNINQLFKNDLKELIDRTVRCFSGKKNSELFS